MRCQSGKAKVSSNEEAQSEEELNGAANSQDKILTNNQSQEPDKKLKKCQDPGCEKDV